MKTHIKLTQQLRLAASKVGLSYKVLRDQMNNDVYFDLIVGKIHVLSIVLDGDDKSEYFWLMNNENSEVQIHKLEDFDEVIEHIFNGYKLHQFLETNAFIMSEFKN